MMRKAILLGGILMLAGAVHAKELPEGFNELIRTDEGCYLNNSLSKPKETASWTGGCVDGWADGFGVMRWYSDGVLTETYVGEYKKGRINGVGQYTWQDGGIQTGVWVDDVMQGLGEAIAGKGRHRGDVYVGNFKDGMMHGRGKYHFHMHNEDFQKLSGGRAVDLSDISVRSGKYWVLDVIHDHNDVVAVCGIHEHEECE